jgi:VPDSG-CTERM motif
MNPSKRLLPVLLALAVYCASAAAVSAVTINSNNVNSYLYSSAGVGNSTFNGTNIPASQLLDVTLGAYYSRTQIDYTGAGDNVTLLNAFDQKRSGNLYDYGRSHDAYMIFTVAANTTYGLSGAFSATDVSTAGYLFLYSELYDITSASYVTYSYQYSQSTLNESFVLGGLGGDVGNGFLGSLTGSLIGGHQYQWYYNAVNEAYPDSDGGATATGFVRLDIGGGAPSTVPDSGTTFALLGLGVFSLASYRRKAARS